MKVKPVQYVWEETVHAERVALAIEPWIDTPYMVGQQCMGVGVDCIRFVCGVGDVLRNTVTEITTLPIDAAMHTRKGAIRAMRRIRDLFTPVSEVEGNVLHPGDAVVIGPEYGGPGHILIVDGKKNSLAHACYGTRVVRVGMSFLYDSWRVFRVYRIKELEV